MQCGKFVLRTCSVVHHRSYLRCRREPALRLGVPGCHAVEYVRLVVDGRPAHRESESRRNECSGRGNVLVTQEHQRCHFGCERCPRSARLRGKGKAERQVADGEKYRALPLMDGRVTERTRWDRHSVPPRSGTDYPKMVHLVRRYGLLL